MSTLGSKVWMGWVLALAVVGVNCEDRDVWRATGQILSTPDAGVGSAERCVPGQTFACMGACGAPLLGYQVCAADGLSYGPCICPPERGFEPAIPSVDREYGGRVIIPRLGQGPLAPGNSGGPSGPVVGEGVVGAECRNAQDCISGLECFSATTDSLGFGGPAGGYCSTPCGSQQACTSIDPGSGCATIAGQQVCVRMCASKEAPEGQSKCLAREDVTCVSVAALGDEEPTEEPQLGICVPRCQSDAACPGRRCDLSSGLCTDTPRSGTPIGSDCAAPEDCVGGVCLPLNPNLNVSPICTAFCTRGVPGCGFDGSEASSGATCFFQAVPGEGPGDRGLCIAQCDVDTDCPEPGSLCVTQPETAIDGRAGVCLHPLAPVEPDPGAAPGTTGNACTTAAQCGAGLTCLTPDSDPFGFGGGPAGGYCSAPCTRDTDCPDPGSQCLGSAAGRTFCLRGCAVGEANQCGGRATLACRIPQNGTQGFCQPQCNSDADCGERACDAATGLCVEAAPAPVPECTTDAQCGAGRICLPQLGVCAAAPTPPECVEDADCGGEQICDVEAGECVDAPCLEDADCEPQICDTEAGQCVDAPVSCVEDTECGAQVCDAALGECVDPAPDCTSDADCGAQLCNTVAGVCIDAPAISVGGACTADADCAENLCFPLDGSSFCSGACLAGTLQGCESYGSDAFCAPTSGADGLCIELCSSDADCAQAGYECVTLTNPVGARTGACLPPLPAGACTLDADCGAAEVCDPGTAACIPAPAIPIGGACVAAGECSGNFCLSFGATSACSGICDAATGFGCESYGSDAICLPVDQTNTVGVCVELCSAASDCEQSAHVCEPLEPAGLIINERSGLCLPPAPAAAASAAP